jgi:hypothetical protein
MGRIKGVKVVKLGFVLALTTSLMACQPNHDRLSVVTPGSGQADSGAESGVTPGGGDRKLTIVKGNGRQQNEEVTVTRIHRLEGANIQAWLSDHEVKITTTKLIKAGTRTEEPKFAYTASTVDLTNDKQTDLKEQAVPAAGTAVKEMISPDGKFSFIQKWKDKYTARNFMKNISTGESIELQIGNYMESGGWLDKDTYVLAAGSMEGRGDIIAISTGGQLTSLQLEDPEVEIFNRFEVSQGLIYYTDKNQDLKVFKPGQSRPSVLIQGVSEFEIAPGGGQIAITTAYAKGAAGTKLLMYDAKGSAQGSLIGKGDLIPYFNWSMDGSKLAFAVYTEDKNGMNGVYLFDSSTGRVSPIGPFYFPQYPLSWNPSGTRLGVTIKGEEDLPVTQIIDFK